MDNEKIETLNKWINESEKIVFLGGAGVSTESGIPDFRSVDGLYNQKYDYPPETILSHTFFENNIDEFYKFYKDKMIATNVEPNKCHKKLVELEKCGKLTAIVTQNIDGLHQKAGSENVLELHGSVLRNYCTGCHKFFEVDAIRNAQGVPTCDKCGGIIKPDVVLYEEGLDSDILMNSVKAISECDMLIIGGTSLTVYPAAGLMDYYRGNKLVLINRDATARDYRVNLVINDSLGKVFDAIKLD